MRIEANIRTEHPQRSIQKEASVFVYYDSSPEMAVFHVFIQPHGTEADAIAKAKTLAGQFAAYR